MTKGAALAHGNAVALFVICLSSHAFAQQEPQEGPEEGVELSAEEAQTLLSHNWANISHVQAYQFPTQQTGGELAYIVAVSAEMPDPCHELRLTRADNPNTRDRYEVLAIEVNNTPPDGGCAQVIYYDVETVVFLEKPICQTAPQPRECDYVRVLGRPIWNVRLPG